MQCVYVVFYWGCKNRSKKIDCHCSLIFAYSLLTDSVWLGLRFHSNWYGEGRRRALHMCLAWAIAWMWHICLNHFWYSVKQFSPHNAYFYSLFFFRSSSIMKTRCVNPPESLVYFLKGRRSFMNVFVSVFKIGSSSAFLLMRSSSSFVIVVNGLEDIVSLPGKITLHRVTLPRQQFHLEWLDISCFKSGDRSTESIWELRRSSTLDSLGYIHQQLTVSIPCTLFWRLIFW